MTHNGSICGNDTQAALLAVQFGEGHSWSINITKNNETYQGDFITLTYNTNDTAVFPDAKRKGNIQCRIWLAKQSQLEVSDLVYLTRLGFFKVRRNIGVSNECSEFCTTCCQLLFLVPAGWVTVQAKWLHWMCNSCKWKRRGRINSFDRWGAGRQRAHGRLILVCTAWPSTLPSNTVLGCLCTNAY